MGKSVRELLEEARIKAGAQNYKGHDYMDLMRFDENTRHMIVFDVINRDSPMGLHGERTRLYLSEKGYQNALANQEKGDIRIKSHADVIRGTLRYDSQEQIR